MRRQKTIQFLVCYLVATAAPAFAGPGSPLFDQGLAAFNNGQYLPAAEFFRQEILANRDDVLSHYYLGVAMHCLGRYPDSTREYNWILLNTQDPELISRAQLGLKALAKLQQQGAGGFPPPTAAAAGYTPMPAGAPGAPQPVGAAPPASTGTQTTAHSQASAKPVPAAKPALSSSKANLAPDEAKPAAHTPPKPVIGPTGSLRIVDCYVGWSEYCKAFDPLFDEAKTKYAGTIRFDQVDVEAKNAKDFVQKYKIDAYPTVLFFDKQGKLLTRINGAPPTFEELDAHITSIFPGVAH